MLDHTKPYVEKMHYTDAELAGHVHKPDVKLQSLCVSGFSLFPLRVLAKPYHFGVNWSTLCENKDGIHFFTLKFECHNRYNKLLLCNSENGDIACCNINNSEWGFFFFKNKNRFLLKKQKNRIWNKQVGRFFQKNGFFSTLIFFQSLWFSLDRTIWNRSHHYQFDWVCAAHLECRSLVMKKLKIAGIWIRKN